MNSIVKKVFLILIWIFMNLSVGSSQEIKHVHFELENKTKEILITYDIYDPQERSCDVVVQGSNDQGNTWDFIPSTGSLKGTCKA